MQHVMQQQVGFGWARELTEDEVDLVSGAVGVPGAVVGAAAGAAMYAGHVFATGNGTWLGFAGATVAGAAVGAVGGPVPLVRALFVPRVAAVGGVVTGVAENVAQPGDGGDCD